VVEHLPSMHEAMGPISSTVSIYIYSILTYILHIFKCQNCKGKRKTVKTVLD
jgi:hypothetical protein